MKKRYHNRIITCHSLIGAGEEEITIKEEKTATSTPEEKATKPVGQGT